METTTQSAKVKKHNNATFTEDSSKNKRKRGRPRSATGKYAKDQGSFLTEGGHRTQINACYRQAWIVTARRQNKEIQQKIFGATPEEIINGTKRMPQGWQTEGESIGRALISGSVEEDEAVDIVLNARANKIPACVIASHFRKIRLGEKSGCAFALTSALLKACNRYQRQFPATTKKQRLSAIQNLFDLFQSQRTELAS
jgi:hypothetical protein